MFELLKDVAAPNFPIMANLPRPSQPYHPGAYRKVGLQLFLVVKPVISGAGYMHRKSLGFCQLTSS
jgi:hypothetical protein